VQKPPVPDSIRACEELVFIARATGFQIYVCPPGAGGKPAWRLKAPDADLFDAHRNVRQAAPKQQTTC